MGTRRGKAAPGLVMPYYRRQREADGRLVLAALRALAPGEWVKASDLVQQLHDAGTRLTDHRTRRALGDLVAAGEAASEVHDFYAPGAGATSYRSTVYRAL